MTGSVGMPSQLPPYGCRNVTADVLAQLWGPQASLRRNDYAGPGGRASHGLDRAGSCQRGGCLRYCVFWSGQDDQLMPWQLGAYPLGGQLAAPSGATHSARIYIVRRLRSASAAAGVHGFPAVLISFVGRAGAGVRSRAYWRSAGDGDRAGREGQDPSGRRARSRGWRPGSADGAWLAVAPRQPSVAG
jgi:hypothetical protein